MNDQEARPEADRVEAPIRPVEAYSLDALLDS